MTTPYQAPRSLVGGDVDIAQYLDRLHRDIESNRAAIARLTGGSSGGAGGGAVSALSVPALYKSGLITSATLSSVTVGVGACAPSSGAAAPIAVASAVTKNLSAFAPGNGQGGLTSALATNSWLHIHAVDDGGANSDVILDASASGPAIPEPYSRARRVGSVYITGASQISPYLQNGSRFLRSEPALDVNVTSTGTTAVLRALSVPSGVVTRAIMAVRMDALVGGSDVLGLISPPAVADVNPALGPANLYGEAITGSINVNMHWIECDTDVSSQVRARMSASSVNNALIIYTLGWADYFGETA